jgi:hypothetical protein
MLCENTLGLLYFPDELPCLALYLSVFTTDNDPCSTVSNSNIDIPAFF